MLELKPQIKDKVSIVSQKQQEYEHKYLGSIKPHRGHILYEFNKITKKLKEAEFENLDIHYNADLKKMKKRKKVIVNENCFYLSSLNQKNAIKKLTNLKLL